MENTLKFANQIGFSDVTPYQIVRRVSDKTIEVRRMKAELSQNYKPQFVAGGFSAHCVNEREQEWVIETDESAPVERIRRQKDGQWKNANGRFVLAVSPAKYYDYNF